MTCTQLILVEDHVELTATKMYLDIHFLEFYQVAEILLVDETAKSNKFLQRWCKACYYFVILLLFAEKAQLNHVYTTNFVSIATLSDSVIFGTKQTFKSLYRKVHIGVDLMTKNV